MSTRTTVTVTVTNSDGSVTYRDWSWNGRAVRRHTDKIRLHYKEQGARSVVFGAAIPVHTYGAH